MSIFSSIIAMFEGFEIFRKTDSEYDNKVENKKWVDDQDENITHYTGNRKKDYERIQNKSNKKAPNKETSNEKDIER